MEGRKKEKDSDRKEEEKGKESEGKEKKRNIENIKDEEKERGGWSLHHFTMITEQKSFKTEKMNS